MPAPPRSFLTVSAAAIPSSCLKKDLQVPALDIAGWAIDGDIAPSAVLPTADTAEKLIASGIVEIDGADVIILRAEFERCERAWGLFDASVAESGAKVSSRAKRPAGLGAPPKHDWDAFAGVIAQAACTIMECRSARASWFVT